MINKIQLIKFLELHLGIGILLKNDTQIKFYCPVCNHYKPKLEICIDENDKNFGNWNCWTCGMSKGTRGKTISSLFKKLNFDNNVLTQLYTLLGQQIKIDINNKEKPLFKVSQNDQINIDTLFEDNYSIKQYNHINLKLPEEFKPLWVQCNKLNPEYKNAKYYLKKRGVTEQDILCYKIGYCETGLYSNMIIIPSYDLNNQLNFFYGRAYYEDDNRQHKLPEISKNFVGFENTINWNLPITLVEGGFDAIAVKRNAIPLFGKIISEELKRKIIINKVKTIYIALDEDALQDSIKIIEYFLSNGINIYLIEILNKDPSKMGFKLFTESKYNNSKQIKSSDLLRLKTKL